MSKIIDPATIIKSYNNNIVSVNMNGKERILFAKGIGFGRKSGDAIERGLRLKRYLLLKMRIT